MTTATKKESQPAIRLNDLPDAFREVCTVIGFDKGLELMKAMGGSSIYVPRINRVTYSLKHQQIRKEFNGRNYNELARKYGYTVAWIREILKSKAG